MQICKSGRSIMGMEVFLTCGSVAESAMGLARDSQSWYERPVGRERDKEQKLS